MKTLFLFECFVLTFVVVLGHVYLGANAHAIDAEKDPRVMRNPNSKRSTTTSTGNVKAPFNTNDDDTSVDPRDDMIKYKGLLACKTCETMVEKITVLHHTTPMPATTGGVHDRRSNDKKLKAKLETRNAEILDGLCHKMMKEARRSDEKGDLQMLQLHCESVMGDNEVKFSKFITNTLAANSTRIYVPVGQDKNEKTGKITPKFAYEHETDLLCKKFCVEKNSMKDQMSKMRDEIKRKQQEHMNNISAGEIFIEALGMLVEYWYIAVPTVIILTGLGVWAQIKFMAPRDDKGRPILGRQSFDKAFVAPKAAAKKQD